MFRGVLLMVAAYASLALARATEQDPLCNAKNCTIEQTCRIIAVCPVPESCNLEAMCFIKSELPPYSHEVCQIGQPVLIKRGDEWGDIYCGPELSCPNSTYCNSDLLDTYATCCWSAPADSVKPGECPPIEDFETESTMWCSDQCGTDGDCRLDKKCCHRGCETRCVNPVFKKNVCDEVQCPQGSYCRMPDMESCIYEPELKCFLPGQCMPCKSRCWDICNFGYVDTVSGCEKCKCNPRGLHTDGY